MLAKHSSECSTDMSTSATDGELFTGIFSAWLRFLPSFTPVSATMGGKLCQRQGPGMQATSWLCGLWWSCLSQPKFPYVKWTQKCLLCFTECGGHYSSHLLGAQGAFSTLSHSHPLLPLSRPLALHLQSSRGCNWPSLSVAQHTVNTQ